MKQTARAVVAVILVILSVICLSGCSMFDFFAVESLHKPPKLTGEKAELQLAFEQTVGGDISLFTPLVGENRGAYIIFDANSDGQDEAIVFYSFNDNLSVVHMHLLSIIDGEWMSVGDFVGSGTDIYKVDFYNIDNSKNLEISVIWTLDDSKREKTLSVYRISSLEPGAEDALSSLATIQIADYVYCDVDGDNANELLYFYYAGSADSGAVNARLIDYDGLENSFVPLSEVSLPFEFLSLVQLSYDNEGNDIRFYLDCKQSTDTYFSEIIIYSRDNDALFIPMYEDKYISTLSKRTNDIQCYDFDNDGYLDIPVSVDYSESYALTDSEGTVSPLIFVDWVSFLDGNFESLGRFFINNYDGYALRIDTIYEQFYIVYDYVNKLTQVRLKNSDDENNIIFSVSVAEANDDIVSIIPDGFLGEKENNEYSIVISAKGEMFSFTEGYIKSLIVDM